MKRRVLSFIIALALCLNLFPVGAFAADAGTDAGLCPHHPAHTDTCGYAPPVLEQECTHIHDDGCYTEELNCLHEHTAECYPDSGDTSQADEPVLCVHVCTQDSGCITRTLSCPHEHDDTCGYVAGKPGAPCMFVCAICPIEDLIGKLPSRLSASNAEQVQAQIDEIYTLYDALTDEEQQQVDLSSCVALLSQMDGMDSAVLDDGSTSDIETYELKGNKDEKEPYVVDYPIILITNGNTWTGLQSSAIQVMENGKLYLGDGGAIVSKKGAGVKVQSGGFLSVAEPGTAITGTTYALDIASGAEVHLSAGTYSGGVAAIHMADGNYADLLEEGFAFFDGGNAILPENLASAKALTVGQCAGHAKGKFKPVSGTTTHTWTCAYCGATETEKCTFNFVQDGDGTSTCAGCTNSLSIVVNEGDLSNLVYDGTVKPEDVDVTVTLTGPDNKTTTLTKETDFSVNIEKITDAGQAKVTVTGITFNGTFVKTYIVAQDKPGLSWGDSNPVTVNYDGAPVEAGDLPAVKINIQSTIDDLQGYLQYSYKKQGDTNYISGLPKDVGAYDVIVSLPELPNFEGAVSDPITLTVNKISPVAVAPAATKPIYNRTAQELVTAGELNPVAIKDGLKIEFATSENGPYSTTIPTATNAGSYNVYYKVTVPAGLTDNYITPDPNPAQVTGVEIQRKAITPVVTLSQYSYLYDSGYHEPTVTVIDDEDGHYVINPLDNEYTVSYENNRDVSTDDKPAKVVVTDSDPDGGNYTLETVEVKFKITRKTQNTLSITNKPATFTYGDKFTLGTSGGSGNGLVTWEIVPVAPDVNVATVDADSGQVTITGHGSVTVKATKSGKDPDTNVVNYEDATAIWTFTADKKPVTATVTADDKDYDGNTTATVHAEVKSGVLAGDEITITGLTGTFDNANAGAGKTVTVVTTGATISGHNSEHYDVTYSATTVTATIHKAVAEITTAPVPANLTYNGTAQALIGTAAVVDPADVPVEYALSESGPYSTDFPKGTNAGTYTVWYRVKETDNYTGLAPASVDVTINKKSVNPTITLDQDTFTYDGTAKKPVVTLYEDNAKTITIPAGEYTVAYSNNINVSTADTPATVTVTAKDGGNYSFTPVTKNFTINKEQAKVLTAPEAAGHPLTFNTFAQRLVTAGTASGGTMVYRVGDTGEFKPGIPEETDAGAYTVYYKVAGDSNHSDSNEGHVEVTIAPKTVKDPTIELFIADDTPLVSYTYDGKTKEPKAVVKDGSTVIADTEYNVVYSDNTDAGHGTVNITDKPGGNYTVTGSATFVINKANIVDPNPQPAALTYNGTAQELLVPGTTTGGTVLYALNSATSTYSDAIPTRVNAGTYNVYYKVTGDKNHNDLPVQGPVAVTIQRKPLTNITIELTPDSFAYDGTSHLPTVTVKDGDTVLPVGEYSWACNVSDPKDGGTYTITISDKTGGNYDLTGANPNTKTFTIGKAAQAELVIEGKPATTFYGDTFKLTTSGGSGGGGLTWSATGNASIDNNGTVIINGTGNVNVTVTKDGDTNYQGTSAHWTFTAAPKPVTASIVVDNKDYDGTTTATVASAGVTTINSDTVTIDPASITAVFDTPHAGTGKTVTLDTSKVQVTGDDVAKYAISYPDTVTADITQATTTVDMAPAAIASLTYNGQPQALVTAGQTNVGFLVYSLSQNGEYSREIPTGTNAGTYTVYYKVDGTADYTGVAVNATPISVAIAPKSITPKIELSETSYKYDGTKKAPKVTLKDGDTVLREGRGYTVTWAGTKSQTDADLLRIVDTYTATIKNVDSGNNYTFTVTAAVEITPAEQAALHITGNPEHVYYGDTITTLGTTGGTGEGTVKWSVTAGGSSATIEESTGKLTITGVGAVTVRAERAVDNYGTVGDNWNFTVEPKPVTAEVTVASKTYDGTTAIADGNITANVKTADLVGSDTVTLSGLTGSYTDPNAGTGKTVTLDDTNATKADGSGKYIISYPAAATGTITAKDVTVTVTLSDHDLKTDNTVDPPVSYYEYDGTEKEPKVTVKYTEDSTDKVITASNYTVEYSNNKNVSTTTEKAAVTVTAKDGGNYTFNSETVHFEIRSAAAVLISSPQAKDLIYEKGTEQELVTVGAATGGKVVYSESLNGTYSEKIPTKEEAGTYTVYYKVQGDANHNDTAPGQVSVTIKPREITPTITLDTTSYVYDGTAKTPTVTVKDGTETIDGTEYSVSYRDNVNAGTATVTVSNNNGGNYIVNGSVTFEITKAAPTVTAPTGKPGLQYTGELQDLVSAGVTSHGTVVYSVNGGNYSSAIPTASAVGTYNISWKVLGDTNHSDTNPATLSAEIAKNTVTNPTITLSSDQFKYNGSQQKPTITVSDDHSRVIPEHEYTVSITGTNGNVGMVDVDTYTIKITTPATSNYVIADDGTVNNTRTFEIVPADQETISITGTPAQVRYGDVIQLGVSGGTGDGTVTWKIEGATDTTLTQGGLLTVKDVNTSIKVTVTRSKDNYGDVSASWEFTAAKKPVTADVTVAAKDWDGTTAVDSTAITASVKAADLAFTGDSITITGLTGTYDNTNVGTGKTVTLTGGTVGGTNADKYDVTIPATATASILAAAATVDTEPAANTLTYDASQSQALITAGSATGGTMVYSLDGKEFTPTIPKGKDAGTYTVYYKAQGDGNHTDSEAKTVDVTIAQQSVTPQIELSPPSGQYDGTVQQPSVTVRDTANNVIPASEYKVTYVTDGGKNWKDQGTYTVKVENITGGNYVVDTATADFIISTSAQAPLEIVNKPGLVYYGDTFTLSATGGSGSETVTWSSSDTSIADIDANGLVTIKGTGSATITATKAGGDNYDTATATYPLNALKKPVMAIVTADDKVFDGNTNASIHIIWRDGDLINGDAIQFNPAPTGTFDSGAVGTNKQVTVTASIVNDATAQKYDITIPSTTTASIIKATATAPTLTANNREYDGTTKDLVTRGDANTLYSTTKDGVYSSTVPTGTNAGTYTVWYKAQGDDNHNDSEPQSIEVCISPKTLTVSTTNVTLSGNDLKTDTDGKCYYEYDGTEKRPTVTIKDGAAEVPSSEYTVTYTDNKNVTTDDKKATVTITDKEGGNYAVSGSVTFEIRKGGAQLTKSPEARNLTYTGAAQELVTVGTATGGRIEYKLRLDPDTDTFGTSIPEGTNAGTYTVDYKVVGDTNHTDGPSGSVTVTIQPKTVISPKITVTGAYTYDGTEQKPTGTAVTVEDGNTTIPDTEYTLSYQNNVNAGMATVIITDNNGGNYTVNGTATFEIGKAAATAGTAPTGKTGLKYNGTAQELLDTLGTATGGTLIYSLSETGEYSPAIPTGKAVGEYEIWYKVLGDANHSDSTATALSPKVEIVKNTVTKPIIQVDPVSVKYTGEKQMPTVTVKDDDGLLIDGSEYEVTYKDTTNNNTDLTAVGTYTVTITGVTNGNYTFDTTDSKNTATFTITPADQIPLTITGTRERVYYGDTIQLGTTGGSSGGTVTWAVNSGAPASIDPNGLLKITGTGSVTVTATSTKPGYNHQTATWALYAEKKPVTAVVTANAKDYDGGTTATVTATLQASDFVGTDSFTITLTGCTFEDPNAGTDKKVNVVSTNPTFTPDTGNHENYAITYPNTTTASILKAAVTDVTAPEGKTGLTYTGNPQALVTAGSSTQGTLEYSLDGRTYSASLPTGTDAGSYDVWYRVKGDGNHKDTESTKLANQVNIASQEVAAPIIEFTPDSASYDGAVHKPSVTVKDANHRVIPGSEYTVTYSDTDWKTASSAAVKHIVTIGDEAGGNYKITEKDAEFIISMMGQNPLSIVGQPGEVRYGDSFTLSTTGGSGTGTVTWNSSDSTVATIGANGLVKTLKSGSTTITATKQADANYGAVSVTWALSVEKKPVTAIVTAKDKEYDGTDTATPVIAWKDGDLVGSDTITLNLTGKFDTADAGTGKTVTITGTAPDSDKYTISYNQTTTASITPKAAVLSGSTPTTLTYTGSAQDLVTGITATNGNVAYSTDGSYYTLLVPKATDAGTYPVWYKAQASGNYKDSEAVRLNVTIQPKTVSNPTIELSPDSFEYDGTPKKPDVVVKDGNIVISPSEYTVSYSNNINKGAATVTISNNAGGNYTVNGSKTFTITAGKATLTTAPQAKVLTYTGAPQELVSRGAADNGTVVYSQTETGSYTTTVPRQTNAGNYEVWYKVQNTDGTDATSPQYLSVTIARKTITAEVLLDPEEFIYSGGPCEPEVLVMDLDDSKFLTQDVDYTVRYMSNTNVGTAKVIVMGKGNYSFNVITTFEIVAAKAKFTAPPTAATGLTYNGTAQALVTAGTAEGGTPCYSLDGVSYFPTIPTAIDRGSYTVYAKVQGDSTHEDSDVVRVSVTIGVNALTEDQLIVTLSATSFPYTGGEHKPTVTVTDNGGNVISADEYTVTYSDNVAVGTAKVSIKSKPNGNYSFTASAEFQIDAAGQTPLAITGKKDAVYYGDTLNLGATGGSGDGAVTWSKTGPVDRLGDGQYKVTSSGSVTITATKAASGGYGETKDTWTFYAQPKPVTATVTAANKVYDGNTNATLTVTLNGLLPGESVTSVTAQGQFTDSDVGTNKTVTITSLTIPDEVGKLYAISHSSTTTASITPAPAAVTAAPTLATGPLTYNGGPQILLANDGTAATGGNLMYSLDGKDYGYTIPTGTDAKTYTVWYKVEAADENHKDSAAVKLGDVTIAPNVDTPSILCTPGTLQYDGTEKTPTVVVRDSAQRIIPESEYTVTFDPGTRIAVGTYTVTVTDKPGGNYSFTNPVTGTFEIVPASQNPLSIVTDIPTDVHYGDTFRLSAMGGSGSGAIQWSIEGTAATINANGVVTVTGTGGFTVKAYREAWGGYSDSNTDSVPFEANPKPVTPVVTASDKSYDGNTNAVLTATWKNGDLVGTDTIALTANGVFATADAGSNKRVTVTGSATGTDVDKYAITWPDSTTASIYKVDAKLKTAPAAVDLTYTGSAQTLVTGGSTEGNIGKVEYSTSQNGAYSQTIPTGTNADTYTVWYKVADSVNYTGIAPASIQVEIKKADPAINTYPTASGTAGQKLSDIKFTIGGAIGVPGTFAWENPETVAVAGTAYTVIFTPNDTANYNTVTIQVVAVSASSADNDSGTGGTSTTPPVDTVSDSTQTTIQNGTANTVLSAADGNRLVKEAVQNQSDTIVIKPEITSDVSKTQVSIPASTVSQIQSETDAALTVASPIADVTIPNGALDALGSAGGTVNVVTEQVGGAVALTLTAGGKTVENVPGGVTLTVPAEDAGAGTVAVLVHDDGTREVLQRSVVKDGKLSAPLSGSATVEIVDNGKTFADVQPTDWAAEAVTFASARELFNGTSETTFSPEETTSRGMVATVLYRLEGQPEQALADVYHDVSDDAWYADSVAWAAENGIVNGYGDGQFGPNDSVTREQFVVMLWRYVGSPEANSHDLTAFTDANQINGYALEALCWAVENGVLNGNGNGRLAPEGTATRAEAAQILKNFIENI